jgi:hypothetical protein
MLIGIMNRSFRGSLSSGFPLDNKGRRIKDTGKIASADKKWKPAFERDS